MLAPSSSNAKGVDSRLFHSNVTKILDSYAFVRMKGINRQTFTQRGIQNDSLSVFFFRKWCPMRSLVQTMALFREGVDDLISDSDNGNVHSLIKLKITTFQLMTGIKALQPGPGRARGEFIGKSFPISIFCFIASDMKGRDVSILCLHVIECDTKQRNG